MAELDSDDLAKNHLLAERLVICGPVRPAKRSNEIFLHVNVSDGLCVHYLVTAEMSPSNHSGGP